jgi:hypothetical protein
MNDLIPYATEDGLSQIELRMKNQTVLQSQRATTDSDLLHNV